LHWRECGTRRKCPFLGIGSNNINNNKKRMTTGSKGGKRAGATYEAVFIAEAMRRDLNVLEPRGDFLPYDVLVENKHGGLIRVQIKGTTYKQKRKIDTYRITASKGKTRTGKHMITKADADVLAVYVAPADSWFHIPVEYLTGAAVHLRPTIKESKGQYQVWLDAWNVYQTKRRKNDT